MPNILLQQLENALPAGMQIPEELRQLYQWIEDNGYYEDRDDGVRYGYLYPKNPFRNTYLDDVNVDIDIAFYMEEENFRKELLTISFGKNADDAAQRFLQIAENIYNGSMVALWLDYRGTTQIVRCVNTVEEAGNWEVVKKQLNFNKVSICAKGIDIFVPMSSEDNGLNDDFEGWYDAMMYES